MSKNCLEGGISVLCFRTNTLLLIILVCFVITIIVGIAVVVGLMA